MTNNRNNGEKKGISQIVIFIIIIFLITNPALLFFVVLPVLAVLWYMKKQGRLSQNGEKVDLRQLIEDAFSEGQPANKTGERNSKEGYKSTYAASSEQKLEQASARAQAASQAKSAAQKARPRRSLFDDGLQIEAVNDDFGKYRSEYEEDKRVLEDLYKAGIIDTAEYRDRLAGLKKH